MKITIYELLGKVKDGKAPKKIKYNNDIWEYIEEKENYIKSNGASLNWDYVALYCLKEPVEILEEENKIPEKITINENGTLGFPNGEWTGRNMDKAFAMKINSIIDYLKSKGDK